MKQLDHGLEVLKSLISKSQFIGKFGPKHFPCPADEKKNMPAEKIRFQPVNPRGRMAEPHPILMRLPWQVRRRS
jgi:hypothetical protein